MKRLIRRWLGINDLEEDLINAEAYIYITPSRDQVSALSKEIDTVRERLKTIEDKVIKRKFNLGDKVAAYDEMVNGVIVGFANQATPYTYVVTFKDGYSEVFEENKLTKQDDEQ